MDGARLLVASVCLLGACGDPDPVITTSELRLRVPVDRTCQPGGEVTRLLVEALGDFASATTDQRLEPLSLAGPHTIDRFPLGTELVTVTAEAEGWRAGGLHRVSGDGEATGLLLLPFGRSCVSADPEVLLRDGAAVSALPDGGFVLFGGTSRGDRLRTIVVVPPPGSGELGRVLAEPLSDPRVGATATLVSGRVVIAGGEGEDNDTYDVFDVERESIEFGLLPGTRHHHAALHLGGERVLLVGGEDRDGDPLRTATIIDLDAGDSTLLEGELMGLRTQPQLLRLDDGSILVVGGRVERDGGLVTQVELFEPDAEAFVEIAGATLENWPGAVAVDLPGARVAWLGGEGGAQAQVLTFDRGPGAFGDVTVELDSDLPGGELAALALADGRILVVGEDGATTVDVGRGTVTPADWSRAATALLPLADGSVAELGTEGASLRRELLRTRFDNPPNTLVPADAEWVALDAAPRWRSGQNVSADGAPALAVLPTLVFSDFRVTPVVEGPVDLLLRAADGGRVRVVLDPLRADVLGCELRHEEGDRVTIERRGDSVRLLARSGAERTCRVDLPDRVGLALRVYPGSTFTALADLERL